MKLTPLFLLLCGTAALASGQTAPAIAPPKLPAAGPVNLAAFPTRAFNVRDYGAKGDGVAVDSPAINKAIDAASAAGGGIVNFPAGTYLSFTVRLKSNITLHLEKDAVLLAGSPGNGNAYDAAEPNTFSQYQDGGHSHWMNSFIVGIGLENIAITGPGVVNGAGLTTGDGAAGNKALALKNCRNVVLRDFWILNGGHFALLATGVDDFVIDGVKTDTNRDSFDIDCCRRGTITNCQLNSHNDDALVLKSSYALGEARACEDIVITKCLVTGYDIGTFYSGTKLRANLRAPDGDGPTGRIKFGTESNGGFKRISIADCVFDHSRGLAFETVDGSIIEDVTADRLTMTDINTAPIFFRIGNRARGPEGTPIGIIRRVSVSNLTATEVDARFPILIAGLPGHPVQDVNLSNIRITSKGGLSLAAVVNPPPGVSIGFAARGNRGGGGRRGGAAGAGGAPAAARTDPYAVPEAEKDYPEPSMFGLLPGSGLYARHAENITLKNVEISFAAEDTRPVVVLDDVKGAKFDAFKAPRANDAPFYVLRNVANFAATGTPGLPDTTRADAKDEKL